MIRIRDSGRKHRPFALRPEDLFRGGPSNAWMAPFANDRLRLRCSPAGWIRRFEMDESDREYILARLELHALRQGYMHSMHWADKADVKDICRSTNRTVAAVLGTRLRPQTSRRRLKR